MTIRNTTMLLAWATRAAHNTSLDAYGLCRWIDYPGTCDPDWLEAARQTFNQKTTVFTQIAGAQTKILRHAHNPARAARLADQFHAMVERHADKTSSVRLVADEIRDDPANVDPKFIRCAELGAFEAINSVANQISHIESGDYASIGLVEEDPVKTCFTNSTVPVLPRFRPTSAGLKESSLEITDDTIHNPRNVEFLRWVTLTVNNILTAEDFYRDPALRHLQYVVVALASAADLAAHALIGNNPERQYHVGRTGTDTYFGSLLRSDRAHNASLKIDQSLADTVSAAWDETELGRIGLNPIVKIRC